MHLLRGTARLFFLAAWWALIPFADMHNRLRLQ